MVLDPDEATLIRQVMKEYLALLDSDRSLEDPVMARLFPSASFEDAEVERTFRDMVQTDLDEHKRTTVAIVTAMLEPDDIDTEVNEEQIDAWLSLLTDLRLAIGVRLGVDEEMIEMPMDARVPEQWPLAVMHYLGALQDSLVSVAPI